MTDRQKYTDYDWAVVADMLEAFAKSAQDAAQGLRFIATNLEGVREAVNVLPLFKAPQAQHDRNDEHPADPEPRDVGHPEYEDAGAPAPECTCGHPEWNHGRGGCGTVISYDPHRYCTCTWELGASVPVPQDRS